MNPDAVPPPTSAPPKPAPPPKRRGRPRSPVFAYFRRLVDDKGAFVGNECQFCSFVSRDRSENPTYLTRHILRTCSAPQQVKDAMGVRHPSIAIASFGSNNRFNPPKPGPFPNIQAHQNPPASTASATNSRRGAKKESQSSAVQQGQARRQQPQQSQQHPKPQHQQQHQQPQQTQQQQQHQQPSRQQLQLQQQQHQLQQQPQQPQQPPQQQKQQQQHRSALGSSSGFTASHQQPQSSTQSACQTLPPKQPNALQPSASNGTQTLVRPAGVTKSRRGRPRSPALLHFRRHIDEKGTFIANQCVHCSFVSRDRSENSTLLLRHLLSKSCSTPEDVRVVLRGNRYTPDGKRTSKGAKAAGSKSQKKNSVGSVMDSKGQKATNAPRGYAANPEQVSKALLRFFHRHDLDPAVVESPLFRELAQALTATASSNGILSPTTGQKLLSPKAAQAVAGKMGAVLPSRDALETFWKNIPAPHLLKEDAGLETGYSCSTHLIIYFPHASVIEQPRTLVAHYESSNGMPHSNNPSLIASVFRWIAGGEIKYIGSKNCARDFASCLTEIVEQSQAHCPPGQSKFDQIFIARPFSGAEKVCDIPRNDPVNVWIPDVAREVDILCQELLAQVPLLVRCIRRNKLLASFFRERYSEGAAVILFGRNIVEKEQCKRYLAHISKPLRSRLCRDILENAVETYEILRQAQASHEDPQRLQETGSFLHTISEENSGSVQLCQEVTRLVLSIPYRNELKMFISIMTPLANLISRYSPHDGVRNTAHMTSEVFADNSPLRGRSIAHLLPDCVRTLRELYAEKMQEHDNDLRLLRGHTACRLLGKGTDGFPPIVDDICYVAAFLNPSADLSATKGISVEEAWRRAVAFLHTQYSSNTEISLERVLEQLQSFHRRSGVFSVAEIFSDVDEVDDPKVWWEKHGSLAPDLSAVAMKILSAPTTAFAVVRYISEMNAKHADLRTEEKSEAMEKKRVVSWNLKLGDCRAADCAPRPVENHEEGHLQ